MSMASDGLTDDARELLNIETAESKERSDALALELEAQMEQMRDAPSPEEEQFMAEHQPAPEPDLPPPPPSGDAPVFEVPSLEYDQSAGMAAAQHFGLNPLDPAVHQMIHSNAMTMINDVAQRFEQVARPIREADPHGFAIIQRTVEQKIINTLTREPQRLVQLRTDPVAAERMLTQAINEAKGQHLSELVAHHSTPGKVVGHFGRFTEPAQPGTQAGAASVSAGHLAAARLFTGNDPQAAARIVGKIAAMPRSQRTQGGPGDDPREGY